jgi:hypothetical protein
MIQNPKWTAALVCCRIRSNGQLGDKIKFVERKIFWIAFTLLGLLADFVLPLWWALAATIPIGVLSWWIAYRSEWF